MNAARLKVFGTVVHSNNAYVSGFDRLTPTNANDKVLTNSPAYFMGPLGKYYYSFTDGMLSTLIDMGSRNATNAGLYHYTTRGLGKLKERTSQVDIGFHYVAVDANGAPFDTDLDGLPDYLADANGNGIVDAGETDWGVDTDGDGLPDAWETRYFGDLNQNGTGDVDGDGLNNLKEYQAASNPANNLFAWGFNANGESTVPLSLTNAMAMAVAGGLHHSLALKEGGTIVGWGTNDFGQLSLPASATNVIAIAAGDNHNLALSNGIVIAWGRNQSGQTNVPSGLTNVVAISAGGDQSLALKTNGTVVQWGSTNAPVPASVTNVIAIASGTNFQLALLSNSTVIAWGANTLGTNVPVGLTNVVAIAAGGAQALALLRDGSVTNWGATSGSIPSNLTNAMGIAAGYAHSLVLQNDGTVLAWGDNTYGQTNVVSGLTSVKSLAAGAYHSLAARFSTLIQYPIDVSKDMLLIYNTNSLDSSNVWFYYMQHRPIISNANVLGIGCPVRETITPDEYTNQFAAPVAGWLAAHPTIRPQYVVLFYDVPARVNTNTTFGIYPFDPSLNTPSISYRLNQYMDGWHPFVTHINFATTNDCRAYIDKLEYFGTNYSSGKVILSADAGGYGNDYYFFEDAGRTGATKGFGAENGVIAAGVLTNFITYRAWNESYINNATNVAGFFTWGYNGGRYKYYISYPTNSLGLNLFGDSKWYIFQTGESYNGVRTNYLTDQPIFLEWFSSKAFGGTNYEHTPIGGVTQNDEPGVQGLADSDIYFNLWARGKSFGICAWNANTTKFFQAVGDPLVSR